MDPAVQARKAKLRELEQSLFGYTDSNVREKKPKKLLLLRIKKSVNLILKGVIE